MKDKASIHTLSAQELRQWMIDAKPFVLIDKLTNDHYLKVHLKSI